MSTVTYLRTIQNILMTCWLSGERSLPFGLLVHLLQSVIRSGRSPECTLTLMTDNLLKAISVRQNIGHNNDRFQKSF